MAFWKRSLAVDRPVRAPAGHIGEPGRSLAGERMVSSSTSGLGGNKDRCAVHSLHQHEEGVGSAGREAERTRGRTASQHPHAMCWSLSVASEDPCQLISAFWKTCSGGCGRAGLQLEEASWEATVRAQEEGGRS